MFVCRDKKMIQFILEDETIPKTVYWQTIYEILKKSKTQYDLYVPFEDITCETNWPTLNRVSPFVRGELRTLNDERIINYLHTIIEFALKNNQKQILCINNNPFFKMGAYVKNIKNIIVADINLSEFDRSINKNVISMPALPINCNKSTNKNNRREYLISFRGKNSHPIRKYLEKFNGNNIKIEIINEDVNIDAVENKNDKDYIDLLSKTIFALVPRGDSLFSYRLLEVMSCGCIPVIISDGWILPFDRSIKWTEFSYKVHYDLLDESIEYLLHVDDKEIEEKRELTNKLYAKYLSTPEKIIENLLDEITKL
jgi:hypothetical protein